MRLKTTLALSHGSLPFLTQQNKQQQQQQQPSLAIPALKPSVASNVQKQHSQHQQQTAIAAEAGVSTGSQPAVQVATSATTVRKNQNNLAANLPQEILLQIFSYLLPRISSDDPFSTVQPGSLADALTADVPLLPAAAGEGSQSQRSSNTSSHDNLVVPSGRLPVSGDNMEIDVEDEDASSSSSKALGECDRMVVDKKSAATKPPPHGQYHQIHRCLFVCPAWYHAATFFMYSDPVLETVYDFVRFVDCLDYVAGRVRQLEVAGVDDALKQQLQLEEVQHGHHHSQYQQRSLSTGDLDNRSSSSSSRGGSSMFGPSSSSKVAAVADNSSSSNTSSSEFSIAYDITGKPSHIGLCGASNIRTLRLEHTSLLASKYGAYRIPIKGSEPSPSMFVKDEHIQRIASAFEVLRPPVSKLFFNNCVALTDVAMIHLITTVSETLRTLDLTNCRHIRDVTVRTVARLCIQLDELILRGCGKIGDAAIRDVSIALGHQLQKLDISGCMRINDPGLDFLAKYTGDYTQKGFHVSPPGSPPRSRSSSPTPGSPSQGGAQLSGLPVLPTTSPRHDNKSGGKLTVLCLPGIRRQSRGGLTRFLQEMAMVHPGLRELEFSIPPPPSTSTKSMFSGGPMLFPYLSQLTSLTIRDCEYLDDANLLPISQHCKGLERLVLFNAFHMTDKSFVPILQECGQLQHLTVRGARALGDGSVGHLITAPCARKLRRLDLTDCYELTDETLFMLSSTVPEKRGEGGVLTHAAAPIFESLEHIAIENCRRITFRSVIAVAKALVYPTGALVSLHLSGAYEGVTHRALVHYRDGRNPAVTREIHLATFNERGLVRDEFEVGSIGSGGASLLWNIMPVNQPIRHVFAWHCRFVRQSLLDMLKDYTWIPIEPRKHIV
ncbi:hypothetical protein RI367_000157 [Sorochytrium milnesiophthora]